MTRLDIIKILINKFKFKSYLEIGVRNGTVINNINIEKKDGVDPAGNCNYIMTSDKFFEQLPKETKYDLIFIDGLHEYRQSVRDVSNSLNHLSKNGIIVMHDCNPPTKWHQREPGEYNGTGKWNGTVWKSFIEHRKNRKDLTMFVVDCDWGVGIIKEKSKTKFPEIIVKEEDNVLDYEWLDKNRKMALNLIDGKKFMEWINKEQDSEYY